jgi:hypothetical protein
VVHAAAIADTGAAVCQFPEQAAVNIGLDPSQGLPVNLVTAGGPASRRRLNVDVEVFNVRMMLDVDFGPNVQPLIGRNAFDAVLRTFGYTPRSLLYEP